MCVFHCCWYLLMDRLAQGGLMIGLGGEGRGGIMCMCVCVCVCHKQVGREG